MVSKIQYEGAATKVETYACESVSRRDDSVRTTFCRAGQRLSKEDVQGPRGNTRLEHAVAVTTLALFFGRVC